MAKLKPGRLNPRVVNTSSVLTKFYMLFSVLNRIREFRRSRGKPPERFPGTLQVQTRSGCNSHCVLCPQDKISSMFPEEVMDGKLYEKIALEAASDPRLKGFAPVLQNEPLLDESLFEKIRFFRAADRHDTILFLVTNGILLTPAKTQELLRSGVDILHVSVNGWGKEDFEILNRGKSFAVFQENLAHLLRQDLSRIGLHLTFIMNAKYRAQLRAAVRQYRAMGIFVHVHGISNRGGLVDESLMKEYRYVNSMDLLRNRILKKLVRPILPCCPYPFFQCSVLANGQVLLCTHDWSRRNVVGNLRTNSIAEVWNGEEMNRLRRMMLEGRIREIPACAQCNVFDELSFV